MYYPTELEELKGKHLYRRLLHFECPQGPVLAIDGREFLNFSSNDYLGLAHDNRLIRASKDAVDRWGTGSGASRLISGSLGVHRVLEEKIAAFKKEEKGLLFPSGFMANLGTVQALVGWDDTVWIDRHSHASIVDAARLSGATLRVYPHLDLDELDRLLRRSRKGGRHLVVTDTYFSMDGDTVDLFGLVSVCRRHEAALMVDEAHANGVLGPGGRGLTEEFKVQGEADVVMGTFSKAFGSQGGFVAARGEVIELLINKARNFIYTTAPAPAASAASIEAVNICSGDLSLHDRLWENTRFLRASLTAAGFPVMDSVGPIIPLLLKDTVRALDVSRRLYEQGILIPAIRPPTVPKGTDRLRITVSAKHTEEHMRRLVAVLEEVV